MKNLKTKIEIFKLIIAIVTLIVLINYQIENVYYSYIIEGGEVCIGVSGFLLLIIYIYISNEIGLMFFNFKYGVLLYLILVFVQPQIVFFYIYPKYFNEYSNNVKQEMLKESHVRIGYVYRASSKRFVSYGRYLQYVDVGIDKSYRSEHVVFDENVKKGDTLLLRVSDEYHRVCEVLKWNPTHEEIERYKTPRKFKSFDSRTGKIIEEEVPDEVEGKEVIPSISVELDGVEQGLQLEEHEHDEGVESADIVDIADISNEVEDESIELEEFEYEFQPEKKKQVEENRVIDVRLNVIEKHE